MPRTGHLDAQRRARAVCVRCHCRKVRCDLESQSNKTCTRCFTEGHECRPHIGPRKQRTLRHTLATPYAEASPLSQQSSAPTLPQASPSPFNTLAHRPLSCATAKNGIGPKQPNHVAGGHVLLEKSRADHPPPPVIAQALSDFYFRELFPLIPVLDCGQPDLECSTLLRQSLYFAGSIMRQSTEPPEWSPTAIYGRIKTLLFLNQDYSPLNILTALCILGAWLPYSPDAIVLDNPWQWTGMAIRFALQLRLHEDETYSQLQSPGRVRRIWWYLFNNDTLQSACSGRPGMFPLKESRVRLPEPTDFDGSSTDGHLFCKLTTLNLTLRKCLDLGSSDMTPQGDVHAMLNELVLWREALPFGMQLWDLPRRTRQSYNRPVVEMHIFYLVTVILTCFLGRRENPSMFKFVSMAASSCIACLYEEIIFHEGTTYLLPIHAWANLVATIPRTFSDSNVLNPSRARELEICQQVLERMSTRHTSATFVLGRINDLVHFEGSVFPGQAETTRGSMPAPLPDKQRECLLSLFHFPDNFCPTLDILRSMEALEHQLQIAPLPDLGTDNNDVDWQIDWSSFLFDGPMNF